MIVRRFGGNREIVVVGIIRCIVEGVDLARLNSLELFVKVGRVEDETASCLEVVGAFTVVVRLVLLRLGDDAELRLLHFGLLLVLGK